MHTLTALRTTPEPVEHIYRTRSFDAFIGAITCPACRCNKSGSAEDPNTRNDACTDAACRCHDENATDSAATKVCCVCHKPRELDLFCSGGWNVNGQIIPVCTFCEDRFADDMPDRAERDDLLDD